MFTIYKDFTIDSAHQLPLHSGQCRFLHGHTYRIEVRISSHTLSEQGMVVDFGAIKSLLEHRYDHTCLNTHRAFDVSVGGVYPTAENMAKVFWEDIQEHCSRLPHKPQCVEVRVWETPTSWAKYVPPRT